MGFIEQLFELIMSFLDHERRVYTKVLDDSPSGSLIVEKQNGKIRYLRSTPIAESSSAARGASSTEDDSGTGEGSAAKGGANLSSNSNTNDDSHRRRYKRVSIGDRPDLISGLVGKAYAKRALKIIEHNLRVLGKAQKELLPLSIDSILNGMAQKYRMVPDKYFYSVRRAKAIKREQYSWAEEAYNKSEHMPDSRIHTTSRGLEVRSRAELLIAETLYKYDVPFRYEQILCVGKYDLVPDFTFLDRNDNEFYWEYCGMMDKMDYVDRHLWKRRLFEGVGISEWNDMIYTYAADDGVDMREIESVIQTKILPRI